MTRWLATWPHPKGLPGVLAWACWGIGHAAQLANQAPENLSVRLAACAFALGTLAAVGLAWDAAVALGVRVLPRGAVRWLAAWGATICWSAFTMPGDLQSFAGRMSARHAGLVLGATVAVFSTMVPLAWAAGTRAISGPRRALAALGAVAAGWLNARVLSGLYPAMHLHGAAVAATFCMAALGRAPNRPQTARLRATATALLGALAVWALLAPRSPALRAALAASDDVVLPFVPGGLDVSDVDLTELADDPWFQPRQGLPPVAATGAAKVGAPVVILLTVDALRLDVLLDPHKRGERLHALSTFADASLFFTNARASGSGTVYTLSGVFTGTYFSQQRWTGSGRALFPFHDTHPRFPQRLTQAGVRTVNLQATQWLGEEHGIARGFSRVIKLPTQPEGRHSPWAFAPAAADALDTELAKLQPHEPAFFYAHLLDAHAPYVLGGRSGPAFARYLAELERVERALARIWRAVQRHGLTDRTYLLLASDHGESFGERRKHTHAWGLKDDLIRVPLLLRGPGLRPRRDTTLVSLNDLGPTILDLFRLPCPPTFIGQSLLPLAFGGTPHLTRPVLSETRLKRALIRPDNIKVIRDLRRGTLEVYDLNTDPGELHNRVGHMTPAMHQALRQLDAFFLVHTFREGGYTPPYRP